MRVLTAKWASLDRVSPSEAVVTGESDGDDSHQVLAEKPFFIYVTDGSDYGPGDKIDKVVLDNNKVLIGMRAFKAAKMTPEAVENDPLLAGQSRDTRYFIFISRDYSKIKVIDGTKMKASVVFKTMKKFASKEYKGNFEKVVKSVLKLTTEYDKVNNAKKVLDAKVAKGDLSKAEERKIEKELAELTETQTKIEEQEKKLLKFELRRAA